MSDRLKITLPEHVEHIIRKLNDSGFEAFAVGGCVRDEILGRRAADWDIATEALPRDVHRIFEKTVDTGILHGTVSVIIDGLSYEITTYRTENSYSDFRHPDNVIFGVSLLEDLKRRDFTINALAFHPDCGLVDWFGGLNDLNNKVIKTVGDADSRFAEDALRMLRAVRFSAQLGFEIEPATFESMKRNSGLIKHISIERIREELSGIILSGRPEKLADLFHSGILRHILPELEQKLKDMDESEVACILSPFKYVNSGETARWSVMERICEGCGQIVKRLRFDGKTVELVGRIVRSLDMEVGESPSEVRKAASEIGKDIFRCLLHIRQGFVRAGFGIPGEKTGHALNDSEKFERKNKELSELNRVKRIFKEIVRSNVPLEIKDLAINGNDLIQLGLPEGVGTGLKLRGLLDAVLENPSLNNRFDLLKIATEMISDDAKQTH